MNKYEWQPSKSNPVQMNRREMAEKIVQDHYSGCPPQYWDGNVKTLCNEVESALRKVCNYGYAKAEQDILDYLRGCLTKGRFSEMVKEIRALRQGEK